MKYNFAKVFNAAVLAFILIMGIACTAPVYADKTAEVKLTPEDVPIKVNVGEEFSIVLDANATTGYSWSLAKPLDKEIVALVSNDYLNPRSEKNKVGQGGKSLWKFKAIGAGKALITLEYKRSWEKDKPAAKKKTYFLLVISKDKK